MGGQGAIVGATQRNEATHFLRSQEVRQNFSFLPGALFGNRINDLRGRNQTVPHVHFHIFPRRAGERLLMHAAVKADLTQLRANAERIRRCF